MNFWLVKSEPSTYSWSQLLKEKKAVWDGVRNYSARLNLLAMKKGDLALFYHSNDGMEIVGIAKVVKENYPDATAEDPRWVAVDLAPEKALRRPVTLKEIKATPALENMALVKLSRLSVSPVKKEEFDKILEMSEDK